jgi:hypothetical protein
MNLNKVITSRISLYLKAYTNFRACFAEHTSNRKIFHTKIMRVNMTIHKKEQNNETLGFLGNAMALNDL